LYKEYKGCKATYEQYENALQLISFPITYDKSYILDKNHYIFEIGDRSYLVEVSTESDKYKLAYTEVRTKIAYDIVFNGTVGALFDFQILTLGAFKALSEIFGEDECAKIFEKEQVIKIKTKSLLINAGKALVLERSLNDHIIDAKIIHGNGSYLERHRDAIDELSKFDNKKSYKIIDGDNSYSYLKLSDD
tara:strand:+ start:260 stop:832 length:573 start_codon:yes stop_codon:yes gene_type:complete